jgi:hypothetical protein
VIGGFGVLIDEEDFENSATVFKYDTVANTWSVLAPIPIELDQPFVCVLDGLIYIADLDWRPDRNVRRDSHLLLQYDPVSGVCITVSSTENGGWRSEYFVLGICLYVTTIGNDSQIVSTKMWTAVADMARSRHSFGAVKVEHAEHRDLFDYLIAKAVREGQ